MRIGDYRIQLEGKKEFPLFFRIRIRIEFFFNLGILFTPKFEFRNISFMENGNIHYIVSNNEMNPNIIFKNNINLNENKAKISDLMNSYKNKVALSKIDQFVKIK